MGGYALSAILATVGNMHLKEGAQPYEYPKQPYLMELKRNETPLTEEEKIQKTKELFGMLEIMQHNFEMTEKNNG